MPAKQSSPRLSTLAAAILAGKRATQADARRLAASVLSQDEVRGQGRRSKKKRKVKRKVIASR